MASTEPNHPVPRDDPSASESLGILRDIELDAHDYPDSSELFGSEQPLIPNSRFASALAFNNPESPQTEPLLDQNEPIIMTSPPQPRSISSQSNNAGLSARRGANSSSNIVGSGSINSNPAAAVAANGNNANNNAGDTSIIGQVNSFLSLPHLDATAWFCVGFYLVLMVAVPVMNDGSTSVVLGMNVVIFLLGIWWYIWYTGYDASDAITVLSTGFYVIGSICFLIGLLAYKWLAYPTDIMPYFPFYVSQFRASTVNVIIVFVISSVFIAFVQIFLVYYAVHRRLSSRPELLYTERSAYGVIGACVLTALGLIMCTTTMSIVIPPMHWHSRAVLYAVHIIWAIPLAVTTAYMIGAGLADRDVFMFEMSFTAIILIPWLFFTLANFSFLVLIAFYPDIRARFAVLLCSMLLNVVINFGGMLEVWQRSHILKVKQQMRFNPPNDNLG